MSDEDIDKAVKEAAEYEAQDKKRKEAIDARNDAESFVFQTEKALEEVGDKIDANDLKSLLESTKDAEMTEDQVSELKSKQEALMSKAQNLFTKMYENMQGAAGAAGPDMGGAQQTTQDAGNADDVVDGDYKEV